MRALIPIGLLLAAAVPAFAEGPVVPPEGGPSPEEEIARLSKEISKALRENEEALARLARGQSGDPKKVDVDILKDGKKDEASKPQDQQQPQPKPEGQPEPGPGGRKPEPGSQGGPGTQPGGGPEELLRQSADKGRSIAADLDELLRQAGRMGGGGGGGGSESGGGGGGGSGEKPESKGGEDPKGGEKSKQPPDEKMGKKPPAGEREPPPEIDPKSVFFAKLPDKVREAVVNGDFDQVPEKYRDLIREWTKALSEKDKKQAEKAGEDR